MLLCLITNCSGEKKAAATTTRQKGPVLLQPWNSTFHLREKENGEMLSIGAVFSDDVNVYVYDLARGAVVILDSTLSATVTIPLATIGRDTWAGDDFVADDSQFIFLNSVDRRLELFDRLTGKHRSSTALPADLMAGAQKRSHRTLNRLFLDKGTLMIGNEHYLVAFDPKLGKRSSSAAAVTAGEKKRILLYKRAGSVIMHDSLLKNRAASRTITPPSTHFPVSGKRFFTRGTALYAVEAGRDSVRIAEVQ